MDQVADIPFMSPAPGSDPVASASSLLIAGPITSKSLREVKAMAASADPTDVLILAIESDGGAPHYGYRIMLELRSRYKTIAAVVANEAFSTATMMAIGSDYLFMGPSAVLGPLDTQIPHPERSSSPYISSLDIIRSMESIAQHASELAIQHTANLVREGHGPDSAVEIAHIFAARICEPLTAQIDPYQLHRARGFLGLSVEYAARLLATRRLANPRLALDAVRAKEVASAFATGYINHEFVIHRDELRDHHGLRVQHAEEIPRWETLEPRISIERDDSESRVEWLEQSATQRVGSASEGYRNAGEVHA